MSTYRFELQHVDRAFSGKIPESLWARASRHTTLSAARKAQVKARQEMRRICGPSAHNSHRRIVALKDTPMTATALCGGAGALYPDGDHAPTCERKVTASYLWPAGQPEPEAPLPWINSCPACQAMERANENE